MRTPHEMEQLKKVMRQDEKFFVAYTNELNNLRNLRANALEAASKLPRFEVNDKGERIQKAFNMDEILLDAKKVFKYLKEDGDLCDLSKESIVKSL